MNSPSRTEMDIGLVFLALTTFKDSNNVTFTYNAAVQERNIRFKKSLIKFYDMLPSSDIFSLDIVLSLTCSIPKVNLSSCSVYLSDNNN